MRPEFVTFYWRGRPVSVGGRMLGEEELTLRVYTLLPWSSREYCSYSPCISTLQWIFIKKHGYQHACWQSSRMVVAGRSIRGEFSFQVWPTKIRFLQLQCTSVSALLGGPLFRQLMRIRFRDVAWRYGGPRLTAMSAPWRTRLTKASASLSSVTMKGA